MRSATEGEAAWEATRAKLELELLAASSLLEHKRRALTEGVALLLVTVWVVAPVKPLTQLRVA